MRSGKNIIKSTAREGKPLSARLIVKRRVIEANEEARRIIAEAEAQAVVMRQSAETVARQLREAAYQEGHQAALGELNRFLLDAREKRDTALKDVEQDVLRLAVKLAEKIIGRAIDQDDETLADIVATAIRHARQQEMLVIRVNPADLSIVQRYHDRLSSTTRARYLDIVADPRVGRGGCVVESESGAVDAQLETQLRVLERALLARAQADGR
jgi:type III secretion protein L